MDGTMNFENDFENDFESEFDGDFEASHWDTAEKNATRAFEFYEEGKMSQALEAIDNALETDPSNSRWHFNKALTLDAMSRFCEAIAEYQAALDIEPGDAEIMNCLAVDFTRSGGYDLAIDTFEEIEKNHPDFEPAYCNRIITYTEMGDYELAEQMFYHAQQINENCPLCFYNLGNSFFVQGTYDKAVWCWEKTALLEPAHPQIHYRIAQGCWAMGDNDNAFSEFIEELRNNPGDVEVIFDFGIFLLHTGKIDSAAEKFRRILEVEPDFAPAVHYMGEIELDAGNREKAEKLFERAASLDEQLCGPKFRLAQLALKKEQTKKAFELLAEELMLCPENAEVASAIGIMMYQLGQFDYAMHAFLKAGELGSSNAINYIFMAKILTARGEQKDARQFLEYAMDICPKNAKIARQVAMIYADMKEPEVAIKAVSFVKKDFSVFALRKKMQMQLAFRKTLDIFSSGLKSMRLKK